MTKNHFATLGLKVVAGEEEVKKAYRSLAKQWHPDKNPNPGAEEKFKEIGAAYEYLQNKDRRELLARELSKPSEPSTKTFTSHNSSTSQPSGSRPYYNWDYKGTEENGRPQPSASSTSTGADGGYSKENQSPGSKGRKNKAPHWTDSFHKKPKGRSSKTESKPEWRHPTPPRQKEWKPWASDWQEDSDTPPPTPHFSDAFSSFRTFVDQLGGQFGAAFFFGTDEAGFGLFDEMDPDLDSFRRRPAGSRSVPKQAPHNVASEHGYSGGLDDDLLFHQASGKKEEKTKCPVCNKMVSPGGLARHEQHCGKFDVPSDTDDDDIPAHGEPAYFSDDNSDYFIGSFGKPKERDWRSAHAEVLNRIRRDRKVYEAELKRQASEELRCKWCGRTFNLPALQRHLPICKEHVLRYGRPLNPSQGGGPPSNSKFARARKDAWPSSPVPQQAGEPVKADLTVQRCGHCSQAAVQQSPELVHRALTLPAPGYNSRSQEVIIPTRVSTICTALLMKTKVVFSLPPAVSILGPTTPAEGRPPGPTSPPLNEQSREQMTTHRYMSMTQPWEGTLRLTTPALTMFILIPRQCLMTTTPTLSFRQRRHVI